MHRWIQKFICNSRANKYRQWADYKSGYCSFGFHISPSLCHREPQEQKRNKTLQTNIEFRAPLPNSINVIMYMEFDSNCFVDKTRRITKDY